MSATQIQRIGVFIDGQYFLNVSNYYKYAHKRNARISIHGLHEFIRNQVSTKTGVDIRLCQIVDAHYFRGRLSAQAAEGRQKLYDERVFDDILMSENVVCHYMPIRYTQEGISQEKGVDVWLALEAYELAIYKRFDILALVACDGDYVPLLRKLNTIGTQVMLISWDFEFIDQVTQQRRITRTSQQLLEEASYPIAMHQMIDDRVLCNTPLITNLFVQQPKAAKPISTSMASAPVVNRVSSQLNDESSKNKENLGAKMDEEVLPTEEATIKSTILELYAGFGFIEDKAKNNVFFHHSSLENIDFSELKKGMPVQYITKHDHLTGKTQATKVWVMKT